METVLLLVVDHVLVMYCEEYNHIFGDAPCVVETARGEVSCELRCGNQSVNQNKATVYK